jgi:hypothetical protein
MKKAIFFILVSLVVFTISCKKDKVLPAVNMGYNYFPTNVGHWVAYQVDSIVWDDFTQSVDTFHYKIKELVESEFIDNSSRNTQRIERYIKINDSTPWQIKNVYYWNITPSIAEKTEQNIRYAKLIFPTVKSEKWDGNMYNFQEAQSYKYAYVDKPDSYNSLAFDSTLSVIQIDEEYAISKDYAEEIYARNVGMIYKRYTSISTKPTGEITKGVDYQYTIISYGN